jgi:hypothetical protein
VRITSTSASSLFLKMRMLPFAPRVGGLSKLSFRTVSTLTDAPCAAGLLAPCSG